MYSAIAGFNWDNGNWPKCGKHGVSKKEIEFVFQNTPAIYAHPNKSAIEQRLRAIGTNEDGRYVYVSFTFRTLDGKTLIRPVSARYMHQREVEHYVRR